MEDFFVPRRDESHNAIRWMYLQLVLDFTHTVVSLFGEVCCSGFVDVFGCNMVATTRPSLVKSDIATGEW